MEQSDDEDEEDDEEYSPSEEKSVSTLAESEDSEGDSENHGSTSGPIYINPLANYRPGPPPSGGKISNRSLKSSNALDPLNSQDWAGRIVEISQGSPLNPHQFRSSRVLLHGIPSALTDSINLAIGYSTFFIELYQIGERTGLSFNAKKIIKLLKGGAWEIFPNIKIGTHSMILPIADEKLFSVAPTISQFPIFLNLTTPWTGLSSGDPVQFLGDYAIQAIPNEFTKLSDIGDELVIFRGSPTDLWGAGTEAFIYLVHDFLVSNSCAQSEELTIITCPHYSANPTRDRTVPRSTRAPSMFKEWLLVAYYTNSVARTALRLELDLPNLISHRLVHFPAWTLLMAASSRAALSADVGPLASSHRVSRIKKLKPGVSFLDALLILGQVGENATSLPRFTMGWLETGQWHGPQGASHNSIVLLSGVATEIPLEITGSHQSQLGVDENGRNRVDIWSGTLEGTGRQTQFYQSRRPSKAKQSPSKTPTSSSSKSKRQSRPPRTPTSQDPEGFVMVGPKRTPMPTSTPHTPPTRADAIGHGSGSSVSSIGGRSYLSAVRSDGSAHLVPQMERLPNLLQRGFNLKHRVQQESKSQEGLSDLTKALWQTWKQAHPAAVKQLNRLSASDTARANQRRLETNGPDPVQENHPATPAPPPTDLHLVRFLGFRLSTQCDIDQTIHGRVQHEHQMAWLRWKGTYPAQIASVRDASPTLKLYWGAVEASVSRYTFLFSDFLTRPLYQILMDGLRLKQMRHHQVHLAPVGYIWYTMGAFDRWETREPEMARVVELLENRPLSGAAWEHEAIRAFQDLLEKAQEAALQEVEDLLSLPPPTPDLVLLKGHIIQTRLHDPTAGTAARNSAALEWTDWSEMHHDLIKRVRRPSATDRLTWTSQHRIALEEIEHLSGTPELQEVLWEGLLLRAIRDTQIENGEITDYIPFQQWQEDFPEAQTILRHTDPQHKDLRSQAQRRHDSQIEIDLYVAQYTKPGDNPPTRHMDDEC